jgi:hypothetical protein
MKSKIYFLLSLRKIDSLDIRDFTSSWRDGRAFNALIHSIRPDLIDLRRLEQMNPRERLENAFRIAQDHLGIHRLIDAEGLPFFIFKIIDALMIELT